MSKQQPSYDSRSRNDGTELIKSAILDALKDGSERPFNELFTDALPTLRQLKSRGEEILRLRAYEVLLRMVDAGDVHKHGKYYQLNSKS